MPIDNRKVLQNILIPEMNGSTRRTLTAENADEITTAFSQERLDSFVESGVLEGDWKASRSGSKTSNENETSAETGEEGGGGGGDLTKLTKAELLELAGAGAADESMTKAQIISVIEGK